MNRRYLPLLLLAALLGGCDRPLEFIEVEGAVTRNGRPMPNIEVAFYADEGTICPRTAGLTDAAGRYKLQTEAGQGGAVVGRYRVCLSDMDPEYLASRSALNLSPAVLDRLPPDLAAKIPPSLRATVGKLPAQAPKARVPDTYGQPWVTPFRAEVRTGHQTVDFQIP